MGVTAHWMEHRPVNQRGLQSDSQSGHMPGKKRSVVCVEKMLWLTERVRSGLWSVTVKICPRGRQTRCSGEPSTPGVHWETGREAGDRQQSILIRLWKSFAPAWLCQSHGRLGSTGVKPDGGRGFLTRFPQVVLHWNVRKMFHFHGVCVCVCVCVCVAWISAIWESCGTGETVGKGRNHHLSLQGPVFVQRRWWCLYCGFGRESCSRSSFQKASRFLATCIVPHHTNWKLLPKERVWN